MVYLIENPVQGICKIGVSENPVKRLAALQTATPDPLILRAEVPGSFAEESALHQKFAAARLTGEWFTLTEEIAAHFGLVDSFYVGEKLIKTLYKLDGNEVKVLVWAAAKAGFNTNLISFDVAVKRELASQVGISHGGVENAITQLTKKGYLHRIKRGVYHIDPEITWRGDLKARAKSVQVFLNYKIEQP